MIYPPVDKLIAKVGSKFLLINVVSKRARQINETSHLQMEEKEYSSKKSVGRALEEVSKDLIKFN
jgi:DNA-directed RNA polymerase subunit omega